MKPEEAFLKLYEIIATLRGPDGCAWDREQTPETMRGHLLEETYETIEAIDREDSGHVREELGDVYLLVTMIAYIFEERGEFSVADCLNDIGAKLVRRHPHVFSDSVASTSSEIVEQWDRIKIEVEGKPKKTRFLDAVSSALPPLERANKLQKRAAKVGFDWPDFADVIAKLREEITETEGEYAHGKPVSRELEEEVGDLLFSAVNVARHIGIDPAVALHAANQKFVRRFSSIETQLKEQGRSLEEASLEEMDAIWNSAKP